MGNIKERMKFRVRLLESTSGWPTQSSYVYIYMYVYI